MDDGDIVPPLEPHCGSWVLTREGCTFETSKHETAVKAAALGWKVETTAQYLSRVNRGIRERDDAVR